MKNLKLVFLFMLLGMSSVALALQRYGIGDDEEIASPGQAPFILLLVGSIAAYLYLAKSYSEWYQRKEMTREERDKDVKTNLFIAIIGYLIVAVFLSFPIFFIIKLFGSYDLFTQTRYYIIAVAFAILTYLRRA